MRQSVVFRAVYEAVARVLAAEGEATGLFTVKGGASLGESRRVAGGGEFPAGPAPVSVRLVVCDLCQTAQDKNGQRVYVGELGFEAPARFAMTLALRGEGCSWPALLEALGAAARFFKDNPSVSPEGCAWHGMADGEVFLEPVIREPVAAGQGEEFCLSLYYRVEAALNSEKGESFRRVQKRDVRTLVR